MGVTYVTEWKPIEGKSVQESCERYFSLLEMLGAEKIGNYSIECESFHNPMAPNSKTLHIISCSEYPASRFAQFEEGCSIITDSKITQFLTRLSSMWQPKKGGKLEIKGQSFRFEDYDLKVGVVSHASSSITISLEVEYRPCMYVTKECWAIISGVLQTVMGDQAPTVMPLNLNIEDKAYVYDITADQYLNLFIKLRSTAPR